MRLRSSDNPYNATNQYPRGYVRDFRMLFAALQSVSNDFFYDLNKFSFYTT